MRQHGSMKTLNRRQIFSWAVASMFSAQAGRAVAQSSARGVPPELTAFEKTAAPWQLKGSGALRFFGFKAYDAAWWTAGATANPFASKSLFALEIEYNTAVKAEEIVNVSLVEMARLRRLTDMQVKTWTAEMQRTFPSVTAGDRLTGVYLPRLGARFFFNGRLVSEINDADFSDAFFAIWLDEGTRRGDLRRALLGMTAPAQ